MGLQNQLSDVSSESVLIIMVVLIAKGARYLHSSLLAILHTLGLSFEPDHRRSEYDSPPYAIIGSGLVSVIVLCEQMSLNRVQSHPNRTGPDEECVVCLDRLGEGDHVRRLACRHVFHSGCLDGWLGHLNFSCPLCRAPLLAEERVDQTRGAWPGISSRGFRLRD